MKLRSWLAASGLVIGVLLVVLVCGLPGAQIEQAAAQSPPVTAPPLPSPPSIPSFAQPSPDAPALAQLPRTAAPSEIPQSIPQMMQRLRVLRTKKAELASQEEETIRRLREMVKQQRQSMAELEQELQRMAVQIDEPVPVEAREELPVIPAASEQRANPSPLPR